MSGTVLLLEGKKIFFTFKRQGAGIILGDPEGTANIYCKSRNLPNIDTQNYSFAVTSGLPSMCPRSSYPYFMAMRGKLPTEGIEG